MNSVRQAFDRHAPVYDQVFSKASVRSEVWEIADSYLSPGMHVLDLGCGTGDDALHYARRGLKVSAIDVSPGMVAELKRKAGDTIRAEVADMRAYVAAASARFDAVVSNFGALNCISELDWLRRVSLVPGGYLILTTMGRLYPLEFIVFLLKGRPRLALRRFGRSRGATVENVRFDVYYHRLSTMRRALAPEFKLIQVRGVRSLLPAPGLEHLERFAAVRALAPLDRWLCSHRLTATCADHFVSVWQYRET
jgi:ubiquinone/menaquinone biosynthesis C-methylase UbiE